MAQRKSILDHLRRLTSRHADFDDGVLLERFRQHNDETAFEALLRRHGPMVLGVCRRVLGNQHDVEDAFQATFLILLRKANTIAPAGTVSNWLYGVAHRTAVHTRSLLIRNQKRDRRIAAEATIPFPSPDEAEPAIDQELSRLPDKYRTPIVLCALQGKTHKEAAAELGWPEGTLSVRLMRAKKILADRLRRRGVWLGAVGLAIHWKIPAQAGMTPTIRDSTLQMAKLFQAGEIRGQGAALAEGVLRAMKLAKLKSLLLVLIAALGLGVTTLVVQRAILPTDQDFVEQAQNAPASKENKRQLAPSANQAKFKFLELKKNRIDYLRKSSEANLTNITVGRQNLSAGVVDGERLLTAAEIELSANARERLDCYERARARFHPVAQWMEAAFKVERADPATYFMSVAFRLELEIGIQQEKIKIEAAK